MKTECPKPRRLRGRPDCAWQEAVAMAKSIRACKVAAISMALEGGLQLEGGIAG